MSERILSTSELERLSGWMHKDEAQVELLPFDDGIEGSGVHVAHGIPIVLKGVETGNTESPVEFKYICTQAFTEYLEGQGVLSYQAPIKQ